MSATLALLVDLPMTIGKVFLIIDFIWAFAHTGKLVYKGVRFIADPLVDIGLDVVRAGIYRPGAKWISAMHKTFGNNMIITPSIPTTAFSLPTVQFRSSFLSHKILKPIMTFAKREDLLEKTGDFFAFIGNRTFKAYETYRKSSMELVASGEIIDRSICVLVGYATALGIVAVVAIASGASFGKGSTGVAGQIRVHALFAKVSLDFPQYGIPMLMESSASSWRSNWLLSHLPLASPSVSA